MTGLPSSIGELEWSTSVSSDGIEEWIDEISALPRHLRSAVGGLDEQQLDTCYRPGGWTLRQVVHHVADSHMNSYIRFKHALSDESPEIHPYFEERWAELPEAKSGDIEMSLGLVEAIHWRWVVVLRCKLP
ncbi:MAG TPA: putative metal-dependent hydrolase [Dehalococcoidia bacterium]|nr:putative metal-dependent hydrolase [Dehalococcoidia bacterium]